MTLRADDVPLVEVSLDGWDPSGLGAPPVGLGFLTPVFLLVPIAATLLGGRVAGRGARSTTAAVASGLAAGLVYAAVGVATAWFASIDLPFLLLDDPTTLGPSFGRLALVSLVWGSLGGALGALTERRWPRRLSS